MRLHRIPDRALSYTAMLLWCFIPALVYSHPTEPALLLPGWNNMGTISNGGVYGIIVVGTDVYAVGDFTDAGGNTNADRVARWDGSQWQALGTGLNSGAYAIVVHNGQIHVGGNFTDAGGNTAADRLARWDGANWQPVGTGLSSTVVTLRSDGNDLYAGGNFLNAGGNANADRIARWDGVQWNALGSGLSSLVYSIDIVAEGIVAGGTFLNAGGNANADNIAWWDGDSWEALGPGLSSGVLKVVSAGGLIYAGGLFLDAGGNPNADRVAFWDGVQWNALGTGLNAEVYAMVVDGSTLYAGGAFQNAGGNAPADRIAYWDGTCWQAVETGLNNFVDALAIEGDDLYVGGIFTMAGGIPGNDRMVRWDRSEDCHDCDACTVDVFQDGQCQFIPIVCNDDDPCTEDLCEEGVCIFIPSPDSDNDGTCDPQDGCPNDPDKIAPGVCGCGNPEPGSTCDDGDFFTTEDSIDVNCQCVGIPLPCTGDESCDDGDPCTQDFCDNGFCASTPVMDTDNDGFCDAIDGCPSDPDKTDPGICGCGNDEPGTSCNDGDLCTINDLIDANCNCTGTFQDSDGDGTCDAEDGCLNDPDKTDPGICGCGNDEPGTSCNDGDPCTINDIIDPNCNCTGTFQDSDGDGTCDAEDGCPTDPDKTAPGICGCGNDETGSSCNDGDPCTTNDLIDENCNCIGTFQDSDGDGTCDAEDGCPNDPDKTAPGICGCGNDEPGTACNDGDPCTINDIIDPNCNCTGTFQDSDGDGTCDAEDGCPNDPDKILPGICGCGNDELGTACNDDDLCTINDVIDENCNCTGTFQDADGDGTCDAEDGCPDDPDKIAPGICGCGNDEPGTACNDDDLCTINDLIDENCNCTGIFQDADSDGTCDADDGCPNDPDKILPGICGCDNDEPGSACDDGNPLTINDSIDENCSCVGTLVICHDNEDCDDGNPCTEDICADGFCLHSPLPDIDNDGTCDTQDGCPNDPDKTAPGICGCGNDEPGTSCNDGDPCTINDLIDINCNCTGTFQDSDGDGTCDAEDGCPNDPDKTAPGICGCGNDEPGTSCNDGDPCTINDAIDENCNCAGTFLDSDGDSTCDAEDGCPNDPEKIIPGICGCGNDEPGTACNDSDPCTINDLIDPNCNCTGSFQDSDSDGTCDAEDGCPNDPDKTVPGICGCDNDEPGSPCDDGNPLTENDMVDANCDCVGDLLLCLDDEDCDDGDPCTEDICADGFCLHNPIPDTDGDGACDANDGCPNDPDKTVPGICGCGNDEPGTACNDGDPCTINDTIDENCNCTGTFQDSDSDDTCDAEDGCPNDPDKIAPGICGCGNDEPGATCDDGNPGTINDTINDNCTCVGEPIGGLPPEAVCGSFTVYVNPLNPDYDGPGSQNIWLIPAEDLDGGSIWYSSDPDIDAKRHLSTITFDWTTGGACIDFIPNGTYNNPDKGTAYRTCLAVRNADFNLWRMYKLRIADEFGSDECTGLVKVIPLEGLITAPVILHESIDLDNPERTSSEEPLTQIIPDILQTEIVLYPNPGNDQLYVQWSGNKAETFVFRLTDIRGQLVKHFDIKMEAGMHVLSLDTKELPAGVYIMNVYAQNHVRSMRWVKMSE